MASCRALLPLLALTFILQGSYGAPTTRVMSDHDKLLKVYIKVIDKKLNHTMQNCTEGRVGSALKITIGDQTLEYIVEEFPKCLHDHCGVHMVKSSICKHAKKMHCASFHNDISEFCKEPSSEHHSEHYSHKHNNCKPHCKELAVLKELFRILLVRPRS